ncbi:4-hydroxy-tetrahydrodipicolinate synthase [Patescibacteria group bacterium]|nr:4-hydroxy-tetrahydrodipicolinate synthase [Patescibacteria group bacterium]
MFTGSMVALATPFKNGEVDEERIPGLVEHQLKNGTDVICPCGCTGEAATLTHDEQIRIIERVVEVVAGRVKVVAGTGSNSTSEAIKLTKLAKKAGADGALMITPYYNKPTQNGLRLHYEKIAASVDLPIMLYNVPSRTGVNMLPDTVAKLSKIDNIVAIKEASGSVDQAEAILSMCDITVVSGDDKLILPMMALGAKGVVSVAANVVPEAIAYLVELIKNSDMKTARKLHYILLPLFNILFCETNPIPVKFALSLLELIQNELRRPLTPLEESHRVDVEVTLRTFYVNIDTEPFPSFAMNAHLAAYARRKIMGL